MPNLERNKKSVMAFYDLAFNQARPNEAIKLYSGAEYIQHNPGVEDGKAGFIAYFEEMGRRYPDKRGQLRRASLPPGMARRARLGRHRHFPVG